MRPPQSQGVIITEPSDARIAVYIDFDNIVISRYQQLWGRNAFQRDGIRDFDKTDAAADPEVAARLKAATVDIGAIIDFASSFGTIVLSRAYADWSAEINAGYDRQLMARAVDLTQLFTTTTRGLKNGADIRLAVDVVEDLFRLPDITHVIIVAGDSDYIALAQKSKRLGRYVVGIGVAGSTGSSLSAACDEFEYYDDLPGIERPVIERAAVEKPVEKRAAARKTPVVEPVEVVPDEVPEPPKRSSRSRRVTVPAFSDAAEPVIEEPEEPDPQEAATDLLVRALRIGHAKDDSEDWLHAASVKNQIKRMDPSFNEKPLGYRSFSDFVKSRDAVAEIKTEGQTQKIRLRS